MYTVGYIRTCSNVPLLRQHFGSKHFRNQDRKSIIFELFIDDTVCVFVDFMCMWFHNLVIGCRYFWAIPFNNQMETARLPFNIENQYRVRSLCLLFFIVLFSVRRAEWKRSAIPTMLCYLISVVVCVIGMPIAAGCWLVLCMRILYIFWGITIGRCIISCDKCYIFNTHDSHDSQYCGGSCSDRNEPTSACWRKEIAACARLRKTAQGCAVWSLHLLAVVVEIGPPKRGGAKLVETVDLAAPQAVAEPILWEDEFHQFVCRRRLGDELRSDVAKLCMGRVVCPALFSRTAREELLWNLIFPVKLVDPLPDFIAKSTAASIASTCATVCHSGRRQLGGNSARRNFECNVQCTNEKWGAKCGAPKCVKQNEL